MEHVTNYRAKAVRWRGVEPYSFLILQKSRTLEKIGKKEKEKKSAEIACLLSTLLENSLHTLGLGPRSDCYQ